MSDHTPDLKMHPPHIHPVIRGEQSVAGLGAVESIREHAKATQGEDAYIRIYPAEAREMLAAHDELLSAIRTCRNRFDTIAETNPEISLDAERAYLNRLLAKAEAQ